MLKARTVGRYYICALIFITSHSVLQNRKTAIEAVTAALEKSGHCIEYSKNILEIGKALKARIVSDTNANIKPIASVCLGSLIASVDPENAARLLRQCADGLMNGLTDNKKQLRETTIQALQVNCCKFIVRLA